MQGEEARLDMSRTMSYSDYLQLDALLTAQKPLSPAHDEMLFIVQHQTSELWMKLMLHELTAARRCIAADELNRAFKMLARVSRILEQLVHAWDVLSTMTPPEYTAIRPYLGASSGFQSYQYRCIEYSLGNKNPIMLRPHEHRPDLLARVRAAFEAPSLYDESLRVLARRGLPVPASHVERDWTQPYVDERPGRAGLAAGLSPARRPLGSLPAGRGADGPRGTRSASGASAMPPRSSG